MHGLQTPGVMALDPELRQLILFDHSTTARHFGFINAVNEHGEVIADSESRTPRSGNYAGRDYFIAQRHDARDLLYIGRPFLTQPGQAAALSISRRMTHRDGSFAGVVVGSLRLAYFHELFAGLSVGPHGTIALLRDDGMVLQERPSAPAEIGRILPQDAPFFRLRGNDRSSVAERVRESIPVEVMDPIDHRQRRLVFKQIGDLPLVVVVGLANEDIYAAWRSKAISPLFIVGALGLLNLLLLGLPWAVDGKAAGQVTIRRDSIELAQVAALRARAVEEAEAACAVRTRFLATMSHEVRMPLNSMLGYAELLTLEGDLDPQQTRRVAAIREAGEYLRDVVNRVLDYAKTEAREGALLVTRTDLRTLVAQCGSLVEAAARAKGLRLVCEVADELPQDIATDATRLRVILGNLLANAVKYTAQGTVTLYVTAGVDGIRFAVADSGIGVPADQRDRLFRAFDRLGAEAMGIEGSELGLATAAQLVAGLSGRIGYEENPSGGSIFWVELPPSAAQPLQPPTTTPAPTPIDTPLNLLVVDDSDTSRDIAASMLRLAGHRVTEASSGMQALRQIREAQFDVVLMDLRMAQMDGLETCRRLRDLPDRRGRTPVVAVTAQVLDGHWESWREAGINAYVPKPYDRATLLAAIMRAVRANGSSDRSAEPASPDLTDDAPLLHLETLMQVRASIGGDNADRHLDALAEELAALLAMLRDPAATASIDDLREQTHRIAGDAGQLGLPPLSKAARALLQALDCGDEMNTSCREALIRIAAATSDMLSQRRHGSRKGPAFSTIPL